MKQTTKPNKNKDIVTIGDEWTGEDRPSFICSYCNRTLTKLTDRNNQNESWYCNSCGIDFQPETENIRRETKLSVPDRNTETLAATTPGIPDISIHHTPEPKGAFKALQQKGIKIKDYKEVIPK
jgi:transposase-like protein